MRYLPKVKEFCRLADSGYSEKLDDYFHSLTREERKEVYAFLAMVNIKSPLSPQLERILSIVDKMYEKRRGLK